MLLISRPVCVFTGSFTNYLTSAKFLLYVGHFLSTWVSEPVQSFLPHTCTILVSFDWGQLF